MTPDLVLGKVKEAHKARFINENVSLMTKQRMAR